MIKFNILLFFLNLILIIANSQRVEDASEIKSLNKYRLPNETIPIHYNIRLHPQISTPDNTFEGEIQISFQVLTVTSNVVLHSKNLTIDELATSITKNGNTLKPKIHIYDEITEMLQLGFEEPLNPGIYTLNMKFKGEFNDRYCGFFKSFYEKEGNYVPFLATHFQKTSARQTFPCWDEPALKATFNISLKHFNNYTALSNMPVRTMEHDEIDGKDWTHFETTPVMSTNILAFIISNFTYISNSDDSIKVWANEYAISDIEFFMETIERGTLALSEYLNSSVRVPKMDHVIVPHYSSRAVENWGLIIYVLLKFSIAISVQTFSGIYYLPRNMAVPRAEMENTDMKMLNVMTVIHEISHQWFGNLVSPSWWKYFWMSEGLATYMKFFISNQLFEDWRVIDGIAQNQLLSFSADESSSALPINREVIDPKQGWHYAFVYMKPSHIFWMLSNMIGEDIFRTGLINYINAHEYGSVTSDDLWEAMQNALHQSGTRHLEIRVKDIMDTWIEQTGYPMITVMRNYTTGDITISQELPEFISDKRKRRWWVPINYATKSKPDFSVTKPTRFLKPDDDDLIIKGVEVNDWIILNLQQTGYYRINYDTTNWRKIAKYLNTQDYMKIHVGNRIQLLDTAFQLLRSKQFEPKIFTELIEYLQQETDLVVWSYVFSMIRQFDRHIQNPSGGALLKPYILNLMKSLLETIDYDESLSIASDFARHTTLEAITLACKYGDPKCRDKAATRLHSYLEDPRANKITPAEEYRVFCSGLANQNQSVWRQLLEQKMRECKKFSDEMLNYFSCAEESNITMDYLELALSKNATILQYTTLIDMLLELDPNIPTNTDVAIVFLSRNHNVISSIDPSYFIFKSLVWELNSLDQLQMFKQLTELFGINMDSDIHYRQQALFKIEEEIGEISRWLKAEQSS